ncbi:MAG: glutamate 5-kinase [bacterium]
MIDNIIVCKIGSQVITSEGQISQGFLTNFFKELKRIHEAGWQPILVVSGAVATGRSQTKLESKQARAAFGQLKLMRELAKLAEQQDLKTALLLISREDIINRARYEALRQTLEELTHQDIIPVINENDATALPDQTEFLDNDQLATIIAIVAQADRLFLLTNVDGIFTNDPRLNPSAKLIDEIEFISQQTIRQVAKGSTSSGRGGIRGKLRAARIATAAGIPTIILNGTKPEQLSEVILSGASHGTYCLLRKQNVVDLKTRDRWLLSAQNSDARIQLDSGAIQALKNRKSLLAVGIQQICGQFDAKDCVELIDSKKEVVALGQTTISSQELEKMLKQSEKPYNVEVIHADNIFLL